MNNQKILCNKCQKKKLPKDFYLKKDGSFRKPCKECSYKRNSKPIAITRICSICDIEFSFIGKRNSKRSTCDDHYRWSKHRYFSSTEKRCPCCKRIKHFSEFNNRPNESHANIRSHCKSCESIASQKYIKQNPNKLKKRKTKARTKLYELKSKPCSDCNKTFHPFLMEYDHVKGQKKHSVSHFAIIGNYKGMLTEISKCDLVCVLCHRIRTWNRNHPEDTIDNTNT